MCSGCGKEVESWSDGNPYYLDHQGQKQYAYHPDQENLSRCIGNDEPYICLSCGEQFVVDSLKPISACPKCSSKELVDTFDLEDKACPFCKAGKFKRDDNYHCIS